MKKTITTLIDDLDGTALPDGAKATTFSLDGVIYTVDLSEMNREKLAKALSPFIEVSTRLNARGGRRSGAAAGSGRSKEELADIRTWATANGMKVSGRGRVPGGVIDAYDAAH